MIIEGKRDGKTVFLVTLPQPETLIKALCEKSSFFTPEKCSKIMEKMSRLDQKTETGNNDSKKVRTPNLVRSSEEDDKFDIDDELSEIAGSVEC